MTEPICQEDRLAKSGLSKAAKDKSKRAVGGDELKVFVGALPKDVDEESVKALFADCSEIRSFFMPMNQSRKKPTESKGYALVTFESQEGLEKALALNGKEFKGRNLIVQRKSKQEKKEETTDLEIFVGGLYSISRKKIRSHFSSCGEIQSFEMPLTKQGESKGIAFISYKTQEALDKALALDSTQLGTRNLTVQRKVPKEKGKDDAKESSSKSQVPQDEEEEEKDPHAAALAALESASDEASLRAALDHARTLGFNKKDVAFKRAKERLYGDTPTC